MSSRFVSLIALFVFAGCSAVSNGAARMPDRSRPPRPEPPAVTVAAPQSQEPKIDQREPGLGQRRFRVGIAPLRVVAEIAGGTVQVNAPETTIGDRANAAFLQVGIEDADDSWANPAIHLRGFATDDDMFGRSLINDGMAPALGAARVTGMQAFAHMRMTAGRGTRWEFPARLGVSLSHIDIAHDAGVDREWLTLAPRLELEPRMTLIGTRNDGLDLFARFGGELGYGRFREDFKGGSGRDSMPSWAYNAGVGVRWNFDGWWFDVGYDFGQRGLGGTDTALFENTRGTVVEHQRLFIGGALQF